MLQVPKSFTEPSSLNSFYNDPRQELSAFEQWFEGYDFFTQVVVLRKPILSITVTHFLEYLADNHYNLIDSIIINVAVNANDALITGQSKWLRDAFENFINSNRADLERKFLNEIMESKNEYDPH